MQKIPSWAYSNEHHRNRPPTRNRNRALKIALAVSAAIMYMLASGLEFQSTINI